MRVAVVLTLALLLQGQSGQPPKRPFALIIDALAKVSLPASVGDDVLNELEYDRPEDVRGAMVDLNHDAHPDFIVRSANSLCGNGGCVWMIVDGATSKILGRTFGEPIYIQAEDSHGYAAIAALSHMGAEQNTYTTWTFDGTDYKQTSSREVTGAAFTRLMVTLDRIPIWRIGG